jgi:hypothetical protein
LPIVCWQTAGSIGFLSPRNLNDEAHPIKVTQKGSVQTLPRKLPTSREERHHARDGIPAANNAHNRVMAHQQACRYPVRQEKK